MHDRLTDEPCCPLHLSEGFLRGGDERRHLALHLANESHDLQSRVTKEGKGRKRNQSHQDEEDVNQSLADPERCDDESDDNDQDRQNRDNDLVNTAPPGYAL